MAEPRAARPWRIMLPLIAMLVLFAAWSAYWWIADRYAEQIVAEQRLRLAAQGIALACGKESWGGYPFRFEFDCASPRITVKDRAKLSAGHVLAVAQAYNPTHLILLIDGPSAIEAPGQPPLAASHGRAIVSLRMIGRNNAELSADIPDVRIADVASAADVQLFSRPGTAPATFDIAARLKDARAALPGRPPIAADHAQAIATIDGPLHATIADISAEFGTARIWAKGDAGLDAAHRPRGRLTVATNDLKGMMAILDPQLDLTDKQRAGLAMALAFLGKEAKTDIAAQDGELRVGPLNLGPLAPLF